MRSHPTSLLFVCMGNICRSPSAQGVAEARLAALELSDQIRVDSAGTHGYHVGDAPDARAIAAAARRGIDLRQQRARQVCGGDFERFDYVVAMDRQNLRLLRERRLPGSRAWLGLLGELSAPKPNPIEIPDPYYGGVDGFEEVLDLLSAAIAELLPAVLSRRNLSQQRDSESR